MAKTPSIARKRARDGRRDDGRDRLIYSAGTLKALVREFADVDDDTACRGVYLALMSRIFETLRDSELTVNQLKTLATVLQGRQPETTPHGARRRTARVRDRSKPAASEQGKSPIEQDPAQRLQHVVRQLYGVDLAPEGGPLDRGGSAQVVQGNEYHRDQGR